MIIEFMRLENWRGFYGINELHFATDKEKNVTLIRAENGVGKTSLLAALNWCLFEILPSENEFENPKKLINNDALQRGNAKFTRIVVEFTHGEKRYKASRTQDNTKNLNHNLKLVEIIDGSDIPLASNTKPDRLINSIIPREMAPHFFFYGEATSKYTGTTGAKQFGQAVKGILGATVAEMALRDLGNVLKDYTRQAALHSNEEATTLNSEISDIINEIEGYTADLERKEKEESEAQELVERLNIQLAGTETIKAEHEKLQKLEKLLTTKKNNLEKAEKVDLNWLDKFGTSILSQDFGEELENILLQEDTKKKIPGPYNEKFVNEILSDNSCICGRPIEKDSVERSLIESLLENASQETVISRVIAITNLLASLDERSKEAWDKFHDNKENLTVLSKEISDIDADIRNITEKLKSNSDKDIAKKEETRETAKLLVRTARENQITIHNKLDRCRSETITKQNKLKGLIQRSEAAKRFVKRAQITGDIITRLQSKLTEEEDFARISIKLKIDKIIEKFMRKNLTVQINSDYQLKVFDELKNEVAKSTGENQLLGLAFTGAIAEFAKDRRSEVSDFLLSGTEAPLVVDSPFGHLDPTYRQGVAEFLPNMASQVVLLVSTSQASPEVMEELAEKIGSQYLLISHNESTGENKKEETITVKGKTFNLTKYNQDFTGTILKEIV